MRQLPTAIGYTVEVFGFSQNQTLIHWTVWLKGKAHGHAKYLILDNVSFEIKKSGLMKTYGLKVDGTPSKQIIKCLPDKYGRYRKYPYAMVKGTLITANNTGITRPKVAKNQIKLKKHTREQNVELGILDYFHVNEEPIYKAKRVYLDIEEGIWTV